jgi:lysophospholipase L1-like esterase
MPKKRLLVTGCLLVTLGLGFYFLSPKILLLFERYSPKAIELRENIAAQEPISNPVPKRNLTKIVLLGDSMTERLGNLDILQRYMNVYYPGRQFLYLNYGYGSTNVLSAQERLDQTTWHGRVFQPILNIDFDVILIESFGNNPLSQYPLQIGKILQYQALDKMIQSIRSARPNAKIIFVATIAPNRENYAKPSIQLSAQDRAQWADERSFYIKNHIEYAREHNIPVIDVYDKSTNFFGDGDLDYIDNVDHIHPSPKGVYLISEEIATYFYQHQIFQP